MKTQMSIKNLFFSMYAGSCLQTMSYRQVCIIEQKISWGLVWCPHCVTEMLRKFTPLTWALGFSGKNKPTQWSSTETVFKATDFLPVVVVRIAIQRLYMSASAGYVCVRADNEIDIRLVSNGEKDKHNIVLSELA